MCSFSKRPIPVDSIQSLWQTIYVWKDPCYISYKESTIISHLEQCFKINTISKFPSEGGREVRKKVIEEVKVLVYCTCRYPDTSTRFGNMARCDFCGEWFHEDCVGNIPQEVFEEDAEYFCSNCQFWTLIVFYFLVFLVLESNWLLVIQKWMFTSVHMDGLATRAV